MYIKKNERSKQIYVNNGDGSSQRFSEVTPRVVHSTYLLNGIGKEEAQREYRVGKIEFYTK